MDELKNENNNCNEGFMTIEKYNELIAHMDNKNNYFQILNDIDVSEKVEKKNGLSYLSWAYAWGELKKKYPNSYYTIYENKDGWNYFTDGKTCWVKTGVTVIKSGFDNGLEHIEYLPIMDYRNNSIHIDKVTSTDVNKAIQRSLTKACARHGVGLYIYAGEDLPETKKKEQSRAEEFDNHVKEDLRKSIKEKAKKENKKHNEVLVELEKEYGKVSEWGIEKMININNRINDNIKNHNVSLDIDIE